MSAYGCHPKNKLEEQIRQYLNSIDGMLVESHQLVHVQQEISRKIEELNASNKRCQPKNPRWHYRLTDHFLDGIDVTAFKLKPARFVKFFTP